MAGADGSERYFKNKDEELSFLDEICTVYCSDMYKTCLRAPKVMCFLLDNIAA